MLKTVLGKRIKIKIYLFVVVNVAVLKNSSSINCIYEGGYS
jgi:hypothetical protein